MTNSDHTFSENSLYGSAEWVAHTLGVSVDSFRRKRPDLEARGFPKRDKDLLRWHKEDVLAWISGQSQDRISVRIFYGMDENFIERMRHLSKIEIREP